MSGFRPRFFVQPSQIGDGVEGAAGRTRARDEAGSGADQPAADLTGSIVTLGPEDSHHALRVLRLRPGDECEVVVGAAVHAATVLPLAARVGSKSVRLQLGERLEGPEAGARYERPVVLVQALTRPAALDWSIEKSTEAGADLILLVQTAGSPRAAAGGGREARWARIAREAAKQSKQTAVPAIEIMPSFTAALERVRGAGLLPVLLDPGAERNLYEVVERIAAGAPAGGALGVAVWVGPESGWTIAERQSLMEAGVTTARLGRAVLRTETAGPVAVAVARLALGDW